MNLRNKFLELRFCICEDESQIDNFVDVADDFTIGFADWKDNNCFKATGIMLWYINMDEEVHGVYNNRQLLEIYKRMYEGTE